jgi:AraC-like DNA-binding protein
MVKTDLVPIFRFRTSDYPERDRFHVWVKDNLCECSYEDDGYGAFDAQATGAALGPLIISGRHWPARPQPLMYHVHRTARRIRLDGHESIRFTLLLGGRFLCRATNPQSIWRAGDLLVLDVAQTNDCMVEAGDVISLVVPRHLLPSHTARLHGQALTNGAGRLFADHLLSLFRNLPKLREHEIPSVVRSTLLILSAAVSPSPEALEAASVPIQSALQHRIQRYIDTHLLEPDLSPDRICRAVGLSRARLYQLFEGDGGVMRQIKRKRLRRAYHMLADPMQSRIRVAELAWEHGFVDVKYFHRSFKAEFGHTPKETLQRPSSMLLPYDAEPVQTYKAGDLHSGWTLPFGVLNT